MVFDSLFSICTIYFIWFISCHSSSWYELFWPFHILLCVVCMCAILANVDFMLLIGFFHSYSSVSCCLLNNCANHSTYTLAESIIHCITLYGDVASFVYTFVSHFLMLTVTFHCVIEIVIQQKKNKG